MVQIKDPGRLCLDFLRYQVSQKSISPHTLRAYSRDLAQAFQLGAVRYSLLQELSAGVDLDSTSIYEHHPLVSRLELPKKGSLASKNRQIATLKSFFKWAYESQHLSQDFGLPLVCPKRPHKVPHFVSVDEAIAVLNSYQEVKNPNEKLLFLLLYGGGLRVSEACEIKTKNILWNQRKILIMGKGHKERLISLPELVWTHLKNNATKSDYLFGDQPLNTRKAYAWIQQAGSRAGLIRPLHPHALRHSFATHLLNGGVNLRILQTLLGHESLTATEKYTHLSIDQLARTMENLHPLGEKKNSEVSDV